MAGGAALGAASADAGTAGAGEPAIDEFIPLLRAPQTKGVDHLVVVMFENRSFDNVLGYLYDETSLPAGQRFDGLGFGHHANPDPVTGGTLAAHAYSGGTDAVMSQPDPDPGEEYPHVNTQLFGIVDPPENATRVISEVLAPYNAPPGGREPTNDGFVLDYVNQYRAEHGGSDPAVGQYEQIMGSFTPEMLPVFSALARNFAVYDSWHAGVPSQTYCNRSFFHASTSHGFVTNNGDGGYGKWLAPTSEAATIFNRLEAAGKTWRVYFDDVQLISVTGFIHAPSTKKYWRTNFRRMSEFYSDAEEGTLPDYAFIEPRLVYDHNDMHPPVGPSLTETIDGQVIQGGSVSDARAAEALLHNIYQAVRTSGSQKGSNALNTMLLVTFDEHGGTYDHAAPPEADPPGELRDTEMDFAFDRLGLRVPTIAISAWTPRGTVINDPMHHGSVIATLCEKYGMPHLTARDRGAPTLANAVTLDVPRQPRTWPETHPQWLPANPESIEPVPGEDDHALSTPGAGLMGMLVAYRHGDPKSVPYTYRGAYDLVVSAGKGLFGPYDPDTR